MVKVNCSLISSACLNDFENFSPVLRIEPPAPAVVDFFYVENLFYFFFNSFLYSTKSNLSLFSALESRKQIPITIKRLATYIRKPTILAAPKPSDYFT